jgi:hypothetical protein
VHFVALAVGAVVRAKKCTLANQYFVARTTRAATRATFLPYSQRFVAISDRAPAIATKYCLPRLPLTFAGGDTWHVPTPRTDGFGL